MLTLQIIQQAESQADRYQIEITLKSDRLHQSALADVEFKVKEQEQENIRWYLEDFLQYPQEPAPKIAHKVEQKIVEMGVELFEKVFHANNDTHQVWLEFRDRIKETRVEIVTSNKNAATIPWELIRDPESNMPLALCVGAFVRTNFQTVQDFQTPQISDTKIRILVVICRPRGDSDVPFRSVATKLIKALTDSGNEVFQLDVLRPPTYSQLERVLWKAKQDGKPYQIVHFDGHGIHEDLNAKRTGKPPKKMRGYLVFENSNSQSQEREDLVHGELLGQLLTETGVSLLVLNACRSAYIEAPAEPGQSLAEKQTNAYGSLAQEVIDAGVAGVVAMRYNIYVFTAAEFVANLYETLALGQTLGEAVTQGRLHLHVHPMREIAYNPLPLQDWAVPMVYEAAPVALFPNFANTPPVQPFNFSQNGTLPPHGIIDSQLPKSPDAGFFGRDETLLTLDRAFDTQRIALLHSYAGSGKTSTSAEFGRWYAQTGGLDGSVLFTSFERYRPLKQVLDKIGVVLDSWLEAKGVHWLALNDDERRDKALEVLQEVSVLWIWDNVESVAGFPNGTESAWSAAEQKALVDFLEEARQTKAKFLLTSRRDEREWLGELPIRIAMPPMPMQERVQLTRAIAQKRGHQLTEVEDWRPLLQFSQGNPLTITVLVGQALRDGLRTKQQMEDFVAHLRAGEAAIEDDEREGRSKSLGASLSYGFAHAFTEEERKKLALLHFFQGIVDVRAFCFMGNANKDWCVPIVRGLTRETAIGLFNRATELGLLVKVFDGYYVIHPVVPWYIKKLFDQYYSSDQDNTYDVVNYAFVKVKSSFGSYCVQEYEGGNRDIILELITEESNLLYAIQLARANRWWSEVINIMQSLILFYEHTGRYREKVSLVEKTVIDFVEPGTGKPLPDREEQWSIITNARIRIAIDNRDWYTAEELERLCVDWNHHRVTSALALQSSEFLDIKQEQLIYSLAVSLINLGIILAEQGKPECVEVYEQAIQVCQRLSKQSPEPSLCFNLGKAYTDVPVIRNLEQAERWYQRSLELCNQRHDALGISKCLGQLGLLTYEKFKEASNSQKTNEELVFYLDEAASFCYEQINWINKISFTTSIKSANLAVPHNLLARIYGNKLDINKALSHYRQAIRYFEESGNLYGAARACVNTAADLAQVGRFDDALYYAQAAALKFKEYGSQAISDIDNVDQLIVAIEQAQKT